MSPELVKEEEILQSNTACCEEFTHDEKRSEESEQTTFEELTKHVAKEHDVLSKNHVPSTYKIIRK